jgi:hypothetical protein
MTTPSIPSSVNPYSIITDYHYYLNTIHSVHRQFSS